MSREKLLSGYHFQVEWGSARIGFTEISGLEVEVEQLEYREGHWKDYFPIKIPGQRKDANIVLKRGVVQGDNELYEWFNTTKLLETERRDLTISLLDEEHSPRMVWKVKQAWPVKIKGPVLNALESTLAIETLEIAHQGCTVEND